MYTHEKSELEVVNDTWYGVSAMASPCRLRLRNAQSKSQAVEPSGNALLVVDMKIDSSARAVRDPLISKDTCTLRAATTSAAPVAQPGRADLDMYSCSELILELQGQCTAAVVDPTLPRIT